MDNIEKSKEVEQPGCGGLCPCPTCTCGKDCKCAILKSPQCDPCGVYTNEQKKEEKKELEQPGCGGLCPCPTCTCGKDCKCAILKSPQCDPCGVYTNEQKK